MLWLSFKGRRQAALVGKGSLSSFDHFHVKGSAAATVAKEATSSPRRGTPKQRNRLGSL